MITLEQFRTVLNGNMQEFSRHIGSDGISYFQTPNELTAVYNTDRYPYIVYQERGFINRGGKLVTKHKGFISVKAEGKLDSLIYNNSIEPNGNDALTNNKSRIMKELGGTRNV